MGMGFAPTWLRQVSPGPPASQNHFNHWKPVRRDRRACDIGDSLQENLLYWLAGLWRTRGNEPTNRPIAV